MNKFKSVWIYPKLWRILNNWITLNAIETWNLNRFKGAYKHEKIKNQKPRKWESFLWVQLIRKQDGFTRLLSWNVKRMFVSTNATGKNTPWKPVSNDQYNFLDNLCNRGFFTEIPFLCFFNAQHIYRTRKNNHIIIFHLLHFASCLACGLLLIKSKFSGVFN